MSRRNIHLDEDGNHVTPDPDLVALGQEIKNLYREILMERYGVRAQQSKAHDWAWYRAAELARSREMDARQFVTRQLTQMAETGTFWVEGLTSWAVMERAANASKDRSSDRLAKYRAQLGLYGVARTIYGDRCYRDPAAPYSPAVRYALALRAGDQEGARTYKREADLEIAEFPIAASLVEVLTNG